MKIFSIYIFKLKIFCLICSHYDIMALTEIFMRFTGKNESLRYKLLKGFFILTLFVILCYFFYIYITYNYLLKYEEEKINIYNKSVSLNINNDIKNIINDINSLTSENDFKEWNLFSMQKLLSPCLKKHVEIIDSLLLVDGAGNINLNFFSKKNYLDKNVSNYDFFSKTIAEKKVMINDNIINKKFIISISFPIFRENKENVSGMIVMFLNLSNRNVDIFNNIIDPNTYQWQILLVNSQGFLLFHSHKKIESRNLSELDYSKNPAVKKALSGKWELNEVKIGNEVFYNSSELVSLTGWYVIVLVPKNLIRGNIFEIIFPNIILFFILMIIVLSFIWFEVSMLLNSIIKLTNAIREYGEKGEVKLLESKGNDEIAQAIKTFNNMIQERRDIDREILQIIERERKRIGKEIHDDLEKILNGIYSQYLIIKEELNAVLKIENFYILSYLEKILKLLNQAINKTQSIANGLNPVMLYEGGFIKSINELISNYRNIYSVEINFCYEEDIEITDELVLINFYYIIQEAINNSLKNNKADKVEINLKREYDSIIISIIDNGEKIHESSESKTSEKIINYNARLINAVLNIESITEGNKLTCTLSNISVIR